MLLRHQRRVRGTALGGVSEARVVGEVIDSYARHWVESFRLQSGDAEALLADTVTEGRDHLDAAADAGRGVVLALPHMGSWDAAAVWYSAATGRSVTTVAEPLEPPALFEWFVEQRRHLGMEVLALGPAAGPVLLRALRAGQTVALVCDRDIEGDGVSVEFFDERTTLPAGPATLALRTGAVLLPCAYLFDGRRGHRAVVLPPLDVRRSGGGLRADVARVTQDLARAFEGLVRRAPEQWHLLQPNWPSDAMAAPAPS